MLWPRPQTLSALCPPVLCPRPRLHTLYAMCPPSLRLNSALAAPPMYPPCVTHICPPCVRHVSALCLPPNLVRHMSCVSKPCTPYVRHATALCPLWPRLQTLRGSCVCVVCAHHVSAMCPFFVRHAPALGLLWGGAVASWNKIFLSVVQPAAFILCMAAGQFLWHSFWLRKFWPLQAHPMLEKLFGVYAGIIFLNRTLWNFILVVARLIPSRYVWAHPLSKAWPNCFCFFF